MTLMKSFKVPTKTHRRFARLKKETGKSYSRLLDDAAICLEKVHRASDSSEPNGSSRAEVTGAPTPSNTRESAPPSANAHSKSDSHGGVGGQGRPAVTQQFVETTSTANGAKNPPRSHGDTK